MNRTRWIILAAIVLASLAVQFTLVKPNYWWDRVPLFWGVFGFAGCTAIIFLSKWFGKGIVQRPPDYYREEEE